VALTFEQIKDLVRKNFGDRLSSNQIFSQDEFLGFVVNDMTIPDLVGRNNWTWKYLVITGQVQANVVTMQYPDDMQDLGLIIWLTGNLSTTYKLLYKTPQQFFEEFPDPSIIPSYRPVCYTKLRRQIWFNCPVDVLTNVRLIGYKRFVRLQALSDTPDWLDEDRHMVLVYGSTGMAYLTIEDKTNAQPWLNLYESTVKQMIEKDTISEAELVTAGKFKPDTGPEGAVLGDYWTNPFIFKSP
jgi:hypothetical protein